MSTSLLKSLKSSTFLSSFGRLFHTPAASKRNVDLPYLVVRTLGISTRLSYLKEYVEFLARLYESTGRAIAVTPASALASASALLKMLKFLVKVFMSLYLLKLWMDQVDTLHVGRYWSEVLCCTIMTHLGDLEVKVTDLEIFC